MDTQNKKPFAPKMKFLYNDDDDEPLTFRNLKKYNELLKSESEPLDSELLRIKYVNQLQKQFMNDSKRGDFQSPR
jgi:hypothetical protein